MISAAFPQSSGRLVAMFRAMPLATLGLVMGVIMPAVSALLYPTYTHAMASPALEWSRLIEAPFACCEAIVVGWALRRGMAPARLFKTAPADVKVALTMLIIGLFLSSAILSKRPADSLTISFITVLHILFFGSVAHLVKGAGVRHHQMFLWLLGAGLLILAPWTAYRFIFPPDPSQVLWGSIFWAAATPGFINVRYFGSWTGAICAAFVVILLQDKEHRSFTWSHAFYFLAAAMTIWSGTRAAVMAIGLTVAIIVAMNRKLPTFRSASVVALLTGGALVTAWLLIPNNDETFQLLSRSDVPDANVVTSGRVALWQATFDRWRDSPWLGWGSGSTFWEVFVNWTHTQPHNSVLQFLISWGIVGASGAIWLLGRAIVTSHKRALRHPELQPMLAALYALLIMSLVAGTLHYPRFIMLVTATIAIIISYAGPNRRINVGG